MNAPWDPRRLALTIDRSQPTPITAQIAANLRSAILDGRLCPGTRLPSWLDLAAQLGVSRGTVKAAYEALADELLVFSAGAAGTRVAERRTPRPAVAPVIDIPRPRVISEIRYEPHFIALSRRIWEDLKEEVQAGFDAAAAA